ncbi:MAG: SDR family NAD(P)-dependent oxidoreductase [Acidobacteriota bacterium]
MRLEIIRAIVTGAASGLGRAFAYELVSAGAHVVAGDIDEDGLGNLADQCRAAAGKLNVVKLDVTNEASVVACVAEASQRMGGVNLLVNSAGILRDGFLVTEDAGRVRKLPTAQWRQVLDVNLTGPYLMSREVIAEMVKRKIRNGVVVNISSISHAGNPGQSNYSASKAGLDACTRTWALELAHYGIRVGAIAPGLVDTPILERISDQARSALVESIPLQRIGTPDEIWLALKFVIECDYFTGRVIEVDGGANF